MENPGERLVGDYLRYIEQCDFIDFNVYTREAQGEIDVIGVASRKKKAYVCEVVTHLKTGIQYVKNNRPDTAARLIKKFKKDIQYGQKAFRDYTVTYMLWSPVVHKSSGQPKYDQSEHLKRIHDEIKDQTGIEIQFVVNEDYLDRINSLRVFAAGETKELKSPIMRFLQIEEWCRKNCKIIKKKFKLSKETNLHDPR